MNFARSSEEIERNVKLIAENEGLSEQVRIFVDADTHDNVSQPK